MSKIKQQERYGLLKNLIQSPNTAQPHLLSHSPNHAPHYEKSSFKGYTHGCSFPSSIVSQQGSDIPFIEVEAEIVHCSFASINLCNATEGDSQGEISGLWFQVRRGGTFEGPEDSYCTAAGLC